MSQYKGVGKFLLNSKETYIALINVNKLIADCALTINFHIIPINKMISLNKLNKTANYVLPLNVFLIICSCLK